MKILIVEDEEPIREVMKTYLQQAEFQVEEAGSGEVAILKFNSTVDLVILDLNLPNRDGLDVCKTIRTKSKVPIIIVTARTEELDELKGLGFGADDYVKKPFSPKVLVARIQTMLRRATSSPTPSQDISIDTEKMQAYKKGQRIELTATQFKLLRGMVESPNKVFQRDELVELMHDQNAEKSAQLRTIDAHIKAIRQAVEDDPHHPKYIKTVIGIGYKYDHEHP